ncbi:MAG: hypothetical protein AB1405_09160 [Bdellovibrionota bacterium]
MLVILGAGSCGSGEGASGPLFLVFSTQPPSAVPAGAALGTDPVIQIQDAEGNLVPIDGGLKVTLAIGENGGAGVGGGTLSGTQAIALLDGEASFSGLSIDKAGTYTLVAGGDGTFPVESTESDPFDVEVGAATRLVFLTVPRAGEIINQTWQSFTVRAVDAGGNLVVGSAAAVSISNITGSCGTFSGDMGKNLAGGEATFDDISCSTEGEISFQVSDDAAGLTATDTVTVTVTSAAASIAFGWEPPMRTQEDFRMAFFTVEVQDASGDVVKADNGRTITLSENGTGALTGGTAVTKDGIAVFGNVIYDTVENDVGLTADDGALGPVGPVLVDVEAGPASGGSFERADLSSAEAQATGGASVESVMSADGRFVAFESYATNLVAGDTNSQRDIFVRDRVLGNTIMANVRWSDGLPGTGGSSLGACYPALSADGRWIAFNSVQTNLVADDANGQADLFLRDLQEDSTIIISRAYDGSGGNGLSDWPIMSDDGRFTAYHSRASNLVPGDTNGRTDVFVYDRVTGKNTRASVSSSGVQGTGGNEGSIIPALSRDGRYVAFPSSFSNLVDGDTNDETDVFVHDLVTGITLRASVATDGTQADESSQNVVLSGTGRFVAFDSQATNLVPGDANGTSDVFVRDRDVSDNGTFDEEGDVTTIRISVGLSGAETDGGSAEPTISADGRFLTFYSAATNLIASDGNTLVDIFVVDRDTDEDEAFDEAGQTLTYRIAPEGVVPNDRSRLPWISSDGRFVSFDSEAANLVTGDTNNAYDIFVAPNEP